MMKRGESLFEGLGNHLNIIKERMRHSELMQVKKANRSFIQRLVESSGFTAIVAILIVMNGIMIGVDTDHDFEAMGGGWQIFGMVQEYFFSVAFVVELGIKLSVYKLQFFLGEERLWNIMDFVLVALNCIENFLFAFVFSMESDNMSQMSVLRLLRLLRIIRLVRVIRFVKPLLQFIKGIISALSITCWGMLTTFFFVYLGAIFTTRYMEDIAAQDPNIDALFGTLFRSIFTLFQVSTADSWASAVARPVAKYYPEMNVFFILFICLTHLACMNVVVAVIVEKVLKQAVKEDEVLAKEAQQELQQTLHCIYDIFAQMDVNHSGNLTKEEFDEGLKNTSVKALLQKIEISLEDAEEMFELVNTDSDGQVDLDEFVKGFLQSRGQAQAKDLFQVQNDMKICLKLLHKLVDKSSSQMPKVVVPALEVPVELDPKLEVPNLMINEEQLVELEERLGRSADKKFAALESLIDKKFAALDSKFSEALQRTVQAIPVRTNDIDCCAPQPALQGPRGTLLCQNIGQPLSSESDANDWRLRTS